MSAWLLDRVEDALDDLLADRDGRLALAAELAEEDLRDAGVEPDLSRDEIARILNEKP